MQPTARSLILDLLSTLPVGRPLPVRALVDAGAVFGIAQNSVRVALNRLCAGGLVEPDGRGFYRRGTGASAVDRQVRSWRRIEREAVAWDGAWIGVQTAALPRASRAERSHRTRALRLLGFESFVPGLELRPDNRTGGIARAREQLRALGLDAAAPVFQLRDLDETQDRRARELWDVQTLRDGYLETRRTLEDSAARIPELPTEAAMAESFLLGGDAIRRIVLDPLLPDAILDPTERRRLVDTMQRYDRLGKRCWSGWLEEGQTLEFAPSDSSGVLGGIHGARTVA